MYAALAKYYDAFMADVPYDAWTRYVVSFLDQRRDGVDLACGSGQFTLRLIRLGYHMIGADISKEMLNRARENAAASGTSATFVEGAIESFRPTSPVSFVTVLCDGVNYVKDLDAAFANLYAALSDGGLLIFDISSEYKLTNVIGNGSFSDVARNGVTYIWRNRLNEKKREVHMELAFFEPSGGNLYRKIVETQVQYIHSAASVVAALTRAGFTEVKTYAGFTRKKPVFNTQRIHFIAAKHRKDAYGSE